MRNSKARLAPRSAPDASRASRLERTPPESGERTERALLQRVALRDDAALEELYARYSPSVYSAALSILRSQADAEEVVQETFLHIWTRARDYTPARGSLTAWVVMLARSRAIDRLRTRAQHERLAAVQREGVAFAEPPATPLELTQQAHVRLHVAGSLAALPPEQRQALELAFHDGLSHSEISLRTGDPLGTVKTRIRRGMDRLARLLEAAGLEQKNPWRP